MTPTPEPDKRTVTALRRPPIRQSVLVRSNAPHTFDTFVRTIGVWWPVQPFSAGQAQVRAVTMERLRQGAERPDLPRAPCLHARLLAAGDQLAAGPVTGSPAGDEDICGLGLYQKGSLDAVRQLLEKDPGVSQGLYGFDVMTWLTPAGSVAFPAAPGHS